MYEELLYASESHILDFKREQYRFLNEIPQIKSELLKDVLAFANSWRNENAYILIGVEENKEGKATVLGIEIDLDDAQLQQFVNEKTQIPISFSYKTANLNEKKIGVIEITHKQRPVYLKKDYGKLKSNTVYIRRGSSTTEAKPDEIFAMGQKEKEDLSVPDIKIFFSNNKEKQSLGTKVDLKAIDIDSSNYENMPDFLGRNISNDYGSSLLYGLDSTSYLIETETPNKDYYKKLFMHYFVTMKLNRLTFCVSNSSQVLATGVIISIVVPESEEYLLIKDKDIPKKISKYEPRIPYILHHNNYRNNSVEEVKKISFEKLSNEWIITINVGKVLPNSVVYIDEKVNIISKENHNFKISTTVYGDNIPLPIKQDLFIGGSVTIKSHDLDALMELDKADYKSF